MSRWLLALLFAFGTVTFLTGCPAEEETEVEKAAEESVEKAEEGLNNAGDAIEDATN